MADQIPYETNPRTGEAVAYYPGIKIRRTNQSLVLPVLAGPAYFDEREIIPLSKHEKHKAEHEEVTLYPEHEHPNYRWAMAVDLDRCTGCSACVAACYVENNIPVVGPEEHITGREMSWIRIEQHASEAGETQFMPMMCQHCENAPCEPVCPVFAAYHNDEGLNAQIYNRCVGTRYCSNNCPYKVRRFNWFQHQWPGPLDKMLNPDVSVREKGVMEKCTFCIQRIRVAKDSAKDESRKVRDGEVTPACAQTCPTNAIVFGNILDEESSVHKMAKRSDAYRALDELGTEPAVYYKTEHKTHDKA
jgi:molybdopterin-containing oxidoreductase family iron-sulfur binding subunit